MDVYLYGPDLSRMPGLTEIPDISSNRKLTPVRCLQNLSAIRQFKRGDDGKLKIAATSRGCSRRTDLPDFYFPAAFAAHVRLASLLAT